MAAYSAPKYDPALVTQNDVPTPHAAQSQQSDVDDLIRKKRKAREHKACYPCRQRKVKCDLSRPCQTCRDRDHTELCSYDPPHKRFATIEGSAVTPKVEEPYFNGGHVVLGRGEFEMLCAKLDRLEHSVNELKRSSQNYAGEGLRLPGPDQIAPYRGERYHDLAYPTSPLMHTDVHGIHTRNDQDSTVHLGASSIPALLYGLGQGNGEKQDVSHLQGLLGKSVLPLFGLDNESATYPFVDLWGLPHASLPRAKELAKALPEDARLLAMVEQQRMVGQVVFPTIPHIEAFGEEVKAFISDRAANVNVASAVTDRMLYGKSYHWLSLLFAVLATGALTTQMPRIERELTSQPHIENIQALLQIGSVLSNNMNAGTAWSLLGLTIRLAQCLGLHRHDPPNVSTETAYTRSRVWWAIIWHDSLLSITYDRASSTAAMDMNTMPMPQQISPLLVPHFNATMYRLTKTGLDIVHDRCRIMDVRELLRRITEHEVVIARLLGESADYLQDLRICSTMREKIEHLALYLHSSYIRSELYRPSISRSRTSVDLKLFKSQCVENLTNTVRAYLGLHELTAFARQSWAALHRALSSALVLGIIGEHVYNERARSLINRLIAIMDELTTTFNPKELPAPVERGIAALRRLSVSDAFPRDVPPAAALTPADSDTLSVSDYNSPYSVLYTILWGGHPGAEGAF
nr:hypothetical protein CFP56_01386 [Quercus suber]